MLVPMRAILAAADKYRYGQGAFNMNSVGQIEAAVRIHELLHSGAILQGAEASNAFMGGELDFMHGTLEAKKVGAKRIGDAVRKYGADSRCRLRCIWITARASRASRPALTAATPP